MDFPRTDTGEEEAFQVGRLTIGSLMNPHLARIVLHPDGTLRIWVNQRAIDEKAVMVFAENTLYYGFSSK